MASVEVSNLVRAIGSVSSDGTTISRSAGVTFARTGAGTYTATLSQGGIDQTERQCFCTRRGASTATQWNAPMVTQTSDTTLTITWTTGTTGVYTDTDFDCLITHTPSGNG